MDTAFQVLVIILLLIQIPIIFGLIVAFKTLKVVYRQTMSSSGIRIGAPLPPFDRQSITSDKAISNDLISNKPTIIGFISPDCNRCKAMIPHWNEAYSRYHDQYNFLLVGFNQEEALRKMLDRQPVKSELIAGEDLSALFQTKLRSFGYLADTDGKVIQKGLLENGEDIRHLLGL